MHYPDHPRRFVQIRYDQFQNVDTGKIMDRQGMSIAVIFSEVTIFDGYSGSDITRKVVEDLRREYGS